MNRIKKHYNFTHFEPVIVIVFWLLLFASPLLFGRFEEQIEWSHVFKVWINYLPLLGLFLVNRFILLPKLFFKGKGLMYVMSTLVVIVGITVVIYAFDNRKNEPAFPPRDRVERPFENPPRRIPGDDAPSHSPPPPPMESRGLTPNPIPRYANFLILAVLLVGFDTGLKISMRWANLEQEKFKLQKESVENQMAFLRNQVSPHFFMNTLNNIHALIDIDADEAKESIIKLSKLMRHLLYDSEEKLTPIKKEVEFIQSYIELMRLRFTDKVNIEVDIPDDIPDKSIPPLLFTSLLENAFKHGISYNQTSFVKIVMSFSENRLNFTIENSNHPRDTEASSGIGIENTKKRLSLLYKDNFDLEISGEKEIYKVNLNIPL